MAGQKVSFDRYKYENHVLLYISYDYLSSTEIHVSDTIAKECWNVCSSIATSNEKLGQEHIFRSFSHLSIFRFSAFNSNNCMLIHAE